MRFSAPRLLPVLAAVALNACGDGVTAPDTDLSPQERAILGSALFSQALGASQGISLAPPEATSGPEGVPVNFSRTVETSFPCQISGSVSTDASLEITADDETGAVDVNYAVTQAHDNCAFSGSNQAQFLINGTPGTSFDFDFSADGAGQFEGSGTLVGSVGYVIDDRTGTCSTALTFSGSGSEGAGSYVVSGTVCGASLTINVSSDSQ